jgi:hypothetical protein
VNGHVPFTLETRFIKKFDITAKARPNLVAWVELYSNPKQMTGVSIESSRVIRRAQKGHKKGSELKIARKIRRIKGSVMRNGFFIKTNGKQGF